MLLSAPQLTIRTSGLWPAGKVGRVSAGRRWPSTGGLHQSSPENRTAVMEAEWSFRVCSRLKLVSTLKMWINRSRLPEARSFTPETVWSPSPGPAPERESRESADAHPEDHRRKGSMSGGRGLTCGRGGEGQAQHLRVMSLNLQLLFQEVQTEDTEHTDEDRSASTAS